MHCGTSLNLILMGMPLTPSHHDTQHVATIPIKPWDISLRTGRRNPQFEQTPLAPLVCKVKIHEKPHKRLTYATHSVDGWYLGPEAHHYLCYTYYNIDTGGETTPDTIDFFPEFMKMPNYSTRDMAIHADADLEKYLQTSTPESTFQVGDSQLKAIR